MGMLGSDLKSLSVDVMLGSGLKSLSVDVMLGLDLKSLSVDVMLGSGLKSLSVDVMLGSGRPFSAWTGLAVRELSHFSQWPVTTRCVVVGFVDLLFHCYG